MNHFDFPLQLEVFQRNISRGLATVLNPTLLAKQIKVGASLEKKLLLAKQSKVWAASQNFSHQFEAREIFSNIFCAQLILSRYFLTWILNNPCGRRYLLFWDSLFDRKYVFLELVVGFCWRKKMLPIQILVQDHRLNHLFPIWWILFVGGGWWPWLVGGG